MLDDVRDGDADAVVDEAMELRGRAGIVELNLAPAGIAGEEERALLEEAVSELEETSPMPLSLRTDDPATLEALVRSIAGKPLVGPAQGGAAAVAQLVPVAKRYGCALAVPGAGDAAQQAAELAMGQGIPGEDIVFCG